MESSSQPRQWVFVICREMMDAERFFIIYIVLLARFSIFYYLFCMEETPYHRQVFHFDKFFRKENGGYDALSLSFYQYRIPIILNTNYFKNKLNLEITKVLSYQASYKKFPTFQFATHKRKYSPGRWHTQLHTISHTHTTISVYILLLQQQYYTSSCTHL